MRSTPTARVSARRLPLPLAFAALALGSLFSAARAETMPTRNTMDDASDMLSAFARYEMEDSTIDLVDAETGAPLSAKSKAAVADSSPFDDKGDFDLGVFVAAADGGFDPGQVVNVTVCDFGAPENCVKEEPYKGAPESYACGVSDELVPETDFRCVAVAAAADDDGDLSLVEMDLEPARGARLPACAPRESSRAASSTDSEDEDDEEEDDVDLVVTDADDDDSESADPDASEDDSETRRRRKKSRRLLASDDDDARGFGPARRRLAQARQASVRRRAGRSSRSVRAGRARGFTGGRARRGRSRGRG